MTSARASRERLSLISRPGKHAIEACGTCEPRHTPARTGTQGSSCQACGKHADAKDSGRVAFTGPVATRAVFLVSRRSGGA